MQKIKARLLDYSLNVVTVALAVVGVVAVAAFLDANRRAFGTFAGLWPSHEIVMHLGEGPFIFPAGVDVIPVSEPSGVTPSLTLSDIPSIKAAAPAVDYAYYVRGGLLVPANGDNDQPILGLGVTEEFLKAVGVEIEAGGLFLSEDFREGQNVALISIDVAEQLTLSDPIGKQFAFTRKGAGLQAGNAKTLTFTIIGLLKGSTVDLIYPYQAYPYQGLAGNSEDRINQLRFAVENPTKLDMALSQLRAYAESRFGPGEVRVEVRDDPKRLQPQQRLTGFTIAIFAAISLMMAAFNVMSLMSSRVMQRYRDMGIRRSLGASQRRIRWSFLSEFFILSLIGGCLGMLLSLGLVQWYKGFLDALDEYAAAQAILLDELSILAIIVGFGLVVSTNFLFSLFPAVQAARLRIIETIRSEQADRSVPTLNVGWLKKVSMHRLLISIQLLLGALVMGITLSVYAAGFDTGLDNSFHLVAGSRDEERGLPHVVRTLFLEESISQILAMTPAVEEGAVYDANFVEHELLHEGQRFALRRVARVSPAYFGIANITLVEGSFFTERDAEQQAPVIVMSTDAARGIFGDDNPIGQRVFLPSGNWSGSSAPWGGVELEVIGTYTLTRADDWNFSRVYPAAFYPSWLGVGPTKAFTTLAAKPKSGQGQEAREQLLAAVRQYYRSSPRLERVPVGQDFFIEDIDTTDLFNPATIVVSLFAAIALTISLIGIFSSTVLGVSHDMRAIGMKRALGASRRQLTLAFVKGAAGTALVAGTLGVALAALLIPWLKAQAGTAFIGTLELRFEPWIGIVVVLLIALVNAGLGLIPARQISRGQPAEALRYATLSIERKTRLT